MTRFDLPTLSFSSLNTLHNSSHQWVNKMAGAEVPDNKYLEGGRVGEKIIQDHVSGKVLSDSLKHVINTFSVVPEVPFDERTAFENVYKRNGKEYRVVGFADALDPQSKTLLEVKLSGTPWSLNKFRESFQRKMYAWGFPQYTKAVLITANIDPNTWNDRTLKVRETNMKDSDRDEVLEWMNAGIDILQKGQFKGGLDEFGKCTDRWCLYGVNCLFKNH